MEPMTKAADSKERQDFQNERYLTPSAMPASTAQRAAAEQRAESLPGQIAARRDPTSFLALPAEVRLIIYRLLFRHLTVTLRRQHQRPSAGPWNIMRTCQLCNMESLPIFYDLVTIKLQHEMFTHVLRSRVGAQNLARVRSLEIARYEAVGNILASRLPSSLKSLYFDWNFERHIFHAIELSGPGDGDIEAFEGLLLLWRHLFNSSVKQIWSQNHDLRIYLHVRVGLLPEDSSEVQRYVKIRAELVKHNQEEWSWGPIKKIVDH
ncbi:hypothetical protein GJ744_005736 [Endocarpon pusillum]|uniref:Uncharacterized protein n=1 Tax=Endocarpon pusillum TaxID=364733 RepID=A0A8H7APX1_9EURO|nr:hypothetical protein GJ744_005736 [Endocarpon pusillum]